MERPKLDFWFEFASPYSYVGAWQIEEICNDAGIQLAWRSFSLAPSFQQQGWSTSHFNLNPIRGNYMWRDLERLSKKFSFPWTKPSEFPRNCILASKVAAAFPNEDWSASYIRECFIANFSRDEALNDEIVVKNILGSLGIDSAQVLAATLSGERRDSLRNNTAESLQLGIFGAPTCIAAGELFWGEESLRDAAAWARRASQGQG